MYVLVCAAIDLQIEFLSQFHHFGLSETAEFLMLNIEVLLKGRIVNLQTEERKKNSIQDVYLFTYTFVLMYIYKGHDTWYISNSITYNILAHQ